MSGSVIVVGLDGSDGSRRALRWALAEATLRGSTVSVLTVWPSRGLTAKAEPVDADEAHASAVEMQQQLVEDELKALPEPPEVSCDVVHGDPVEALLRASASAELIVVGSHNTSSVTHVMLGSVSEACARMAECPVVVLPMGTPAQRPEGTTAR